MRGTPARGQDWSLTCIVPFGAIAGGWLMRSPRPAPSPSARAAADRPAFRAAVDIVSLNVTVTDGANHYVTDLDQPDFSVFEDGVKQDVTFFTRRQQPIALSLLLDSSASMEDKLADAADGAASFVRRLKSNDIAQVIDFDSRVEIRQAFTGNQPSSSGDRPRTAAGGSTSLHNAIYIALKELRKVARRLRRGRPPPGADRLLRRRGHVEPGLVRRGARPGEATRRRRSTRSRCAAPTRRARASARPSS